MPHDIAVSWLVHESHFPSGTPIAASYHVGCDATGVDPIEVPYGGPHECTLLAVPEGHWTVTCQMEEPDGSMIGAKLSGEIDVPADDVLLDEPLSIELSVVPQA